MGINGLHAAVKPLMSASHASAFAGQCVARGRGPSVAPLTHARTLRRRVGVDAYGWLHRGAFSCAMQLGQACVWQGARSES